MIDETLEELRRVQEILERHPSQTTLLPVGSLEVDREHYQRDLIPAKVSSILRTFNPLGLGVFLVSRRDDGGLFVVDGQHRQEAIIRRLGSSYLVECKVYEGMTIAEEAEVFYLVNAGRGPVKTLLKYRAALLGGETMIVEIAAILNRLEIRYPWTGTDSQDGAIVCWGALTRIYQRSGADHLEEVMTLIEGAWNGSLKSLQAKFIKGVDMLIRFHRHDEAWNLETAIKRLRVRSADWIELESQAKRRRSKGPHHAFYEILHETYNRGRRTDRLDDLRTREPAAK